MKRTAIAILMLLVGAAVATGQTSLLKGVTADVPIEVDSERMELRGKENIVVFSGSVVSRRGDIELSGDSLTVHMNGESETVEKIVVEGNVRIRKGDILVAGERGEYLLAEETFVITGQPRMWRGRDVMEGVSIMLDLTDETVNVEGARIIMFPGDASNEGKGE